jgi:hypothetical protein
MLSAFVEMISTRFRRPKPDAALPPNIYEHKPRG